MSDGCAKNPLNRRQFLGLCGKVAIVAALPAPVLAANTSAEAAASAAPRVLRLLNTHTGERLNCTYREGGRILPDALAAIDRILRDHRTGDVHSIDPALLDLLSSLARRLGTDEPFHVISGYRSPATNAALRRRSQGVAKNSYHLQGKAVDVRLPGVTTAALRAAALRERVGGVGHYPGPGFVHVDTGPLRTW